MPSLNTGNAILSNPIKVDSSYNVGIGGAASGSYKLQVTGTGNFTGALSGTSAAFSGIVSATSGDIRSLGTANDSVTAGPFISVRDTSNAYQMLMQLNASYGLDIWSFGGTWNKRLTLTASGNVGIGTSNPQTLLHLQKAQGSGSILLRMQNDTVDGYTGVHLYGSDSVIKGHFGWANTSAGTLADKMYFGTIAAKDVVFTTNDTERMRITSGGAIQMSNNSTTFSIGSIAGVQRIQYGTGGFTTEFAFLQPNDGYTPIGASAFNTRSDYRLKEDLKEFDGLSLVANMKVYDFKWKEKDERNYGFMAHELQEVVPYVVTGTKDGIFEDEPQMQGLDYGKIVPVLVKAIQEQQAQIEAQQQQINSLINR